MGKNEVSTPLEQQTTPKKRGKFRNNVFPGLAFMICLTGFIFAFLPPLTLVSIIICIIGLIFALGVKSGDYRLDKFGILLSLVGLLIAIIVGIVQLFLLSVPTLLPALGVISSILGILKTILSFFGAGA